MLAQQAIGGGDGAALRAHTALLIQQKEADNYNYRPDLLGSRLPASIA